MLNSGKPRSRLLRPYMMATTVIVVISLVMNHFVLPGANKKRLDFEEEYYRVRMIISNYYAEISAEETLFFRMYNTDDGYLEMFGMTQRDDSGNLKRIVKANKAYNEEGNTWTLEKYMIRDVGDMNDKIRYGEFLDTIFPFVIQDMAHRESIVETMGFKQIRRFIEQERKKGSDEVASFELKYHQRTSYPFAAFVLTLIGFSVASRKTRGGVGGHLALGLLFVFIYIFAMQVTSVAAINVGLPTLLASWIPNMLFGLLALGLYRWTRT